MTRRQFAFWLGFGLFSLSDKLRLSALDALAAALMEETAPTLATTKPLPEHWATGGDKTCRWFERENFINSEWILTGRTTPVNKETGELQDDDDVYLDERLVPASLRAPDGEPVVVIAAAAEIDDEDSMNVFNDGDSFSERTTPQPAGHLPTFGRRSRHGRPPSKWLRNLTADEIRIWLKTVRVPEAGVSGMTYWEHLTRDHMFHAEKIKGLVEAEQAVLHGAAHFGY